MRQTLGTQDINALIAARAQLFRDSTAWSHPDHVSWARDLGNTVPASDLADQLSQLLLRSRNGDGVLPHGLCGLASVAAAGSFPPLVALSMGLALRQGALDHGASLTASAAAAFQLLLSHVGGSEELVPLLADNDESHRDTLFHDLELTLVATGMSHLPEPMNEARRVAKLIRSSLELFSFHPEDRFHALDLDLRLAEFGRYPDAWTLLRELQRLRNESIASFPEKTPWLLDIVGDSVAIEDAYPGLNYLGQQLMFLEGHHLLWQMSDPVGALDAFQDAARRGMLGTIPEIVECLAWRDNFDEAKRLLLDYVIEHPTVISVRELCLRDRLLWETEPSRRGEVVHSQLDLVRMLRDRSNFTAELAEHIAIWAEFVELSGIGGDDVDCFFMDPTWQDALARAWSMSPVARLRAELAHVAIVARRDGPGATLAELLRLQTDLAHGEMASHTRAVKAHGLHERLNYQLARAYVSRGDHRHARRTVRIALQALAERRPLRWECLAHRPLTRDWTPLYELSAALELQGEGAITPHGFLAVQTLNHLRMRNVVDNLTSFHAVNNLTNEEHAEFVRLNTELRRAEADFHVALAEPRGLGAPDVSSRYQGALEARDGFVSKSVKDRLGHLGPNSLPSTTLESVQAHLSGDECLVEVHELGQALASESGLPQFVALVVFHDATARICLDPQAVDRLARARPQPGEFASNAQLRLARQHLLKPLLSSTRGTRLVFLRMPDSLSWIPWTTLALNGRRRRFGFREHGSGRVVSLVAGGFSLARRTPRPVAVRRADRAFLGIASGGGDDNLSNTELVAVATGQCLTNRPAILPENTGPSDLRDLEAKRAIVLIAAHSDVSATGLAYLKLSRGTIALGELASSIAGKVTCELLLFGTCEGTKPAVSNRRGELLNASLLTMFATRARASIATVEPVYPETLIAFYSIFAGALVSGRTVHESFSNAVSMLKRSTRRSWARRLGKISARIGDGRCESRVSDLQRLISESPTRRPYRVELAWRGFVLLGDPDLRFAWSPRAAPVGAREVNGRTGRSAGPRSEPDQASPRL